MLIFEAIYNKNIVKGRIKKLSLKTRQSVYGNILVGLSFMALTFLAVKTFAPDASSNAETIEASAGSSSYAASISTSDTTPINITPTSTQETFTGQNSINYTNACPYGFTVSMSASSENPGLERTGTDSGIKSIPTISSGTTLTDNTWGYSLDNGETYNPVPSISSPTTIINTTSANTDPVSLNLTYGVRINNSIPAGAYSKDVVYTVSVRPQCIVYDLKWDLNSGTGASGVSYDDTEINYGRTLNLQNYKPTRAGYTFAGWKSSATNNTFSADSETIDVNPTNAMEVTLTAQWTPVNYTISYTLNGGSATNPTSYNIETNTITLNNPTRTGYTFAGWTGSNGTTKQTTVTIPKGSTGNKSYTANWTPVTYTISYTMNGGACSSYTNNYTIETNTFSLCTPNRNGYTFAGWTGSNGTTKQTSVSIPKGSTGNKSYTANWTAVNYSISYTLNGGSVSGNPTSYNIETTAFTLKNPTRSGYVFTGWSGTGLSGSANKTVTVAKGSTGNRSYTANWQASDISTISTMQAMTSALCSATSTGTSKNLTDTRDNNVYTVKKLADGKCWMTQNLRLINKTISSSDSNLPSGVTWTVPSSNDRSFDWDTNAAYIDSTYGGYYGFYTATAGWGVLKGASGNSPRDICPKGLRLPTGGSSGEFQALFNKYNSSTLMRGDPSFSLSGHVTWGGSKRFEEKDNVGYYWSSTALGSTDAYNLRIDSSAASPVSSEARLFGEAIRCVAK